MVKTESQMLELGVAAPEFSLPDPDGNRHGLGTDRSAYLVMFICNHCPFVIHVRDELAAIGRDYQARDVSIVAINSNDIETHPADRPEKMKTESELAGYTFPYTYDEDQTVARAYRAACTPDFFLFDSNKVLVYRGQLDGSRPGNNIAVTGSDLRAALDAVLAGSEVSATQLPSVGCNIKWKPGNAPAYFG